MSHYYLSKVDLIVKEGAGELGRSSKVEAIGDHIVG